MSAASPVTTLRTPGGMPAPSASSTKAMALSGVCSAGLITCTEPLAIAGALFFAIIARGKFHGVTAAQMPTGRWWTSTAFPGTSRFSICSASAASAAIGRNDAA